MADKCEEIQVPCEHRFTKLEVTLKNIQENDLKHIQRWIWAIFGTVICGLCAGIFKAFVL